MNRADSFRNNVTGIQHLGIPTGDLGKTIAFYQGLGFELTWQNPGEVAFLQNGAIDHVALNVQDIEAAWSDAQACGYETEDTAINFLPFFERGVKFFTIIGPNREKVEFNQYL